MTSLLYYSISSNLTEDEIIEIDIEVTSKRKTVCIFIRNLASNTKENKNLSITEIAKVTGRGRNTIYKVLKEELNYIQ